VTQHNILAAVEIALPGLAYDESMAFAVPTDMSRIQQLKEKKKMIG